MLPWFIGFVALMLGTLIFGLLLEEAQKDSTRHSRKAHSGSNTTNPQKGDQ